MHILFVKLGSIGDIVHTLPALAAVRRALPGAEISWVVERGAAEILRDNPFLESLIVIDTRALRRAPVSGETLSAMRRQLRRLRASAFDSALDFQGLLKSALIARLSGARRAYGFDRAHLREPASRFLLTRTISVPPRQNVIRKNLSLAAGALRIEVPSDAREFEFPVGVLDEHVREAEAAAAAAGGEFAILNPGGGWPTKLWDAARFGALADALWERPTEWWRNGSPRDEDVCVERTDIGCRTDCHRRACSAWVCMDIEVGRVLAAVEERLRRARAARRAEVLTVA
ncbi:MAG: glycosyltransferase family 9 protein [Acidobacteria bacterium]|nr:glycosyltransferase family 9 protein [Acidobacteriota bacterium]